MYTIIIMSTKQRLLHLINQYMRGFETKISVNKAFHIMHNILLQCQLFSLWKKEALSHTTCISPGIVEHFWHNISGVQNKNN